MKALIVLKKSVTVTNAARGVPGPLLPPVVVVLSVGATCFRIFSLNSACDAPGTRRLAAMLLVVSPAALLCALCAPCGRACSPCPSRPAPR